jgi:hypothetical protein
LKPIDERSYAFVVKVWEERRDIAGAAPTWRGSLDDVQRGDRVYFDTLAELCAHLREHAGLREPPACPARRPRHHA